MKHQQAVTTRIRAIDRPEEWPFGLGFKRESTIAVLQRMSEQRRQCVAQNEELVSSLADAHRQQDAISDLIRLLAEYPDNEASAVLDLIRSAAAGESVNLSAVRDVTGHRAVEDGIRISNLSAHIEGLTNRLTEAEATAVVYAASAATVAQQAVLSAVIENPEVSQPASGWASEIPIGGSSGVHDDDDEATHTRRVARTLDALSELGLVSRDLVQGRAVFSAVPLHSASPPLPDSGLLEAPRVDLSENPDGTTQWATKITNTEEITEQVEGEAVAALAVQTSDFGFEVDNEELEDLTELALINSEQANSE